MENCVAQFCEYSTEFCLAFLEFIRNARRDVSVTDSCGVNRNLKRRREFPEDYWFCLVLYVCTSENAGRLE